MAVIWGLDLHEMKWSKFKSSYMWNKEYYMRRTRFIVYQLAMILCVVSESLGTDALSKYNKQQKWAKTVNPFARVHNNNFVGIAAFNIFVGIYVATIFGSAFFFDLFWPERHESKAVRLAWRICSVLACLLTLACALAYTYIVATQSVRVTGLGAKDLVMELIGHGKPALRYRHNPKAIASVGLLWLGTLATFASTFLLWHCLSHIAKYGPKSTQAQNSEQAEKTVEEESATPAEQSGQTQEHVEGGGNEVRQTTTAAQEGQQNAV